MKSPDTEKELNERARQWFAQTPPEASRWQDFQLATRNFEPLDRLAFYISEADRMSAVEDVLFAWLKRQTGMVIGCYGVKWAVIRQSVLDVFSGRAAQPLEWTHDIEQHFEFTAYSYADCLRWLLEWLK